MKPIEALHYCLNLPIAVQITGIDSQKILDQALEAVRTFTPLTQAEVASLLKRTRSAALEGKYELYKTSTRFDGTQRHPEWLGEDRLLGKELDAAEIDVEDPVPLLLRDIGRRLHRVIDPGIVSRRFR